MRPSRSAAALVGVIPVVLLAMLLAGCGHSARVTSTPAGGTLTAQRCAANRAAGQITYLTGFGFQADAGILDVVAAAAQGRYRAACLNVLIRPGTGDPGSSAELAAAGRVTMAELGSPSDAMTVAANGIKVAAIATYGNVPAITLLTGTGITNLKQLEGRTLGYKGAMPPQITAMLEAAGVDVHRIHEVGVGYDPTILPRGQVAALTAYKSNEPVQLRDDGFHFTEWDPDRYGIKGSFNVLVANPGFAAAHPTAIEDFLRATFQAFESCRVTPAPCIAAAAARQTGYNAKQNTEEWTVQSAEIDSSLLPGRGLGAETVAQWQPEGTLLVSDHIIAHVPDIAGLIDPAPVDAIEQGPTILPAGN